MKNLFKVDGKVDIGSLLISIVIAEGGGFVAGLFNPQSSNMYTVMNKAPFSPPAIVFPIVWTILYFLMAVAAYRIYMKGKEDKSYRRPLTLYAIQLLLNFIWPFVFFGKMLYGLSFLLLLLILVMVILTTISFFKMDKIAGFLMIPYILWLCFAGVLNFYVWKYNEM